MERTQTLLQLVLIIAAGAACSDNPVGRRCYIGGDAGISSQSIIASFALECPSRTCLHVPLQSELPEGSEYADLCTAECSEDSDCDRVPESPCVSGFACAIPVIVGPFCCRKQCICKDYLPDGGLRVPAACVPGVEGNTCGNLPGNEV